MARPLKEIDKTQFEKLCAILCTEKELCFLFEVTDKTLDRWCKRTYGTSFSEVYKKYSARGKMSLRRNQFKLSEKSAAMAIFLGKQYLGQKDNPVEIQHTVSPIDEITKLIFERQQEQAESEEETDE